MKKLLFVFGITFFILFGCSKREMPINPMTKLSSLTKEVLNQPTISTMKQSYRLLSSEERFTLWDLKFKMIIQNDFAKMTESQKNVVLELQNYLNNGFIEKLKNDKNADLEIRNRMPIYEKAFSKRQLYFLMESPYMNSSFSITAIEENNELPLEEVVEEEGGVKSCVCRLDVYCYAGGGGGGRCSESGCKKTADGCGFLGGSPCVGKCVAD